MGAVLEVSVESRANVSDINKIISETFGRNFTGNNWMHGGDVTEGMLSTQEDLEFIGTKGWGESQLFNRVAGYFGKDEHGRVDGSIINVRRAYAVSGIRYATAYENLTGRRVKINLLE